MSFQFQRPVRQSINTSSGSGSGTSDNEHHLKLMSHSGPDYDELIVPLSLYAFDRLSPDDQEYLRKICTGQNVNAEEMDFRELFKKLVYLDQLRFLSQVLNLFKSERLIASFKQLDTDHQQQVIDQMAYVAQESLWYSAEETEENFRLRKFIQLYKSSPTWIVEKFLAPTKHGDDQQEEEKEHISDWKSGFSELFLGFSLTWFQGQWASGQDMLIEQLSEGVAGGLVKIEKDSEIATFTELCKKVVDFRVQDRFLDNALEKLEGWRYYGKKILEPQDYDGAAELLSDLTTLGFGLMSAEYQHHKIEELSNKVGTLTKGLLYLRKLLTLKKQERHDLSEEAIRMRRFRELLDQVSVPTRIYVFKELREVMSKQRRYSEAVHFFSGLGSEDQTEIIEKLVHKISDPAETIAEKIHGESEEDFRLRRFKNVCTKHLSTWDYIAWSEADQERVRQCTFDHNEEESSYAEFLFDASVTWFKARCTNYHRNPIQVLISGEVEVTEKLPTESEAGFRLRRFAESFKKLEFTSKECIFDYVQDTLFDDLGYRRSYMQYYTPPAVGRDLFDSEWIKMKLPNLQGQGAAATTAQVVSATTTHAGGIVIRK